MESRHVQIKGSFGELRCHLADFGGEGPPLLLVHGLGGSHLNWKGVGRELTHLGRVVAPDLAGFGHTPLPGRARATIPLQLEVLEALLESLSPGRPVTLVGNSMGGAISLLLAARRPERVERLILVGPAAPLVPTGGFRPQVLLRFGGLFMPGVGELLSWYTMRRYGPRTLALGTFRLCAADLDSIDADLLAQHIEQAEARAAMPWSRSAFLQATRSVVSLVLRRRHYLKMAAQVRAPTLIIQGEKDRLARPAGAHLLARHRPDWRLHLLPTLGHIPMMEAPGTFVEIVDGWWRGGPTSS